MLSTPIPTTVSTKELIFCDEHSYHLMVNTVRHHFVKQPNDITHAHAHTGVPFHLLLAFCQGDTDLSPTYYLLLYWYIRQPVQYLIHWQTDKRAVFLKEIQKQYQGQYLHFGEVDFHAFCHYVSLTNPYFAQIILPPINYQQENPYTLHKKLSGATRLVLEQYLYHTLYHQFYVFAPLWTARHQPIVCPPTADISLLVHHDLKRHALKHSTLKTHQLIKHYQNNRLRLNEHLLEQLLINPYALNNERTYYLTLIDFLLENDLHPHYVRIKRTTPAKKNYLANALSFDELCHGIGLHQTPKKRPAFFDTFVAYYFDTHPIYTLLTRQTP